MQRVLAHHGGVHDLARKHRRLFFQNGLGTVGSRELDLERAGPLDQHRFLAAEEVAAVHMRDVRFGVGRPGGHLVGMFTRVILHRQRRAAIGVAFAQHRVDRAPLHLVVARASVFLGVGLRLVGEVRQRVALALQFFDRGLQLRRRRADVRQLDDVGFQRRREPAEIGEVVRLPLLRCERFGEEGHDPAGERDVARFERHARSARECLDDRQKRVRRQCRRLVGERINDSRRGRHSARFRFPRRRPSPGLARRS